MTVSLILQNGPVGPVTVINARVESAPGLGGKNVLDEFSSQS
jgi:hypothetical protein